MTADRKRPPCVDIRSSSPCVSRPNQRNKQLHCLPRPPKLSLTSTVAKTTPATWLRRRCEPELTLMLTLAPGSQVQPLITLHYLCRRSAFRHRSARPLSPLFSKFTLTTPPSPPPLLFSLVKVLILEVIHA